MDRYIKAQDVIDYITESLYDDEECELFGLDILAYIALEVPTAKVREEKTGVWGEQTLEYDEQGNGKVGYICPVCKEFVPNKGNFCLNCGARMREKEED